MNPLDETTWNRFASAEMNIAEESEILARCEAQPELWRTAALAIVEHRQLVSALREFASTAKSESSVLQQPKSGNAIRMFLVAASLLAVLIGGLAIGYSTGREHESARLAKASPETPPAEADSSTIVYVNPPAPANHQPTPSDPELTFASLESGPVIPDQARSVLREVGVEVDEQPIIYIFESSTGEHWGIPSTDLQLRYVNSPN